MTRKFAIVAILLAALVLGLDAQELAPAGTSQPKSHPAESQNQPAAAPAGPGTDGARTEAAPNQANPSAQSASPQLTPAATVTVAAPYGEIAGTVKSGNVPLPGVTVSAANTLTGKKYSTSTDVDGTFRLALTGKGRYVVKAEFSAFAPVTQEVLINEQNRSGRADLAMVLLSRAQRDAEQAQRQQIAQQMANAGRGGMQQLSLSGGGGESGGGGGGDSASLAGAGLPNAGLAAEGGNESVAISGAQGRAEQNMFDPGEMQDRIADLRDQLSRQGGGSGSISFNGGRANIQIMGGGGGGGFGGGDFGGGGGGPMVFMMGGGGGRGARGFNVNKPHGSIFYTYGGSILDAKPYSLNGQPENKAGYNQNRFGISMGGPLNIPHIYKGGTKTFLFGSYTGSRSTNAYDVFSTVPTLAERAGDFSALPVPLFDPATHALLANNQVTNINPAAAKLLSFIPAPNLPGNSRNFHFVSASPSDSDTGFLRFNHSFGKQSGGPMGAFGDAVAAVHGTEPGPRAQQGGRKGQKKGDPTHWTHSINGGLIYNNIRNTVLNPFPGLGGKQSVNNYNINFGHTAIKGLFVSSLRFTYNRSAVDVANNFTNRTDIEGQLGITGVSQRPADFGLPVLNFAPQFSNLQDTSPVSRKNQNISINESMSLTHGKHSWTWGGDFRHQMVDASNANNARGTFLFTGAASGAPFADFLFGFAQETSLQSGARDYHFRSNTVSLFAQDNWRFGKNLTFNLGLRYELVTPFTEANSQLVNLDVAPDFSAVAPVLPGQTGPITGRKFPDGLVNADRNNFAPRVGLAWKPWQKTVVRAGYGMNYNIGQYGLMATVLGFQPPFAVAQVNPAPTTTSLTLQNGFPAIGASPNHITNSYAVDPNYRLAYVQSWNLNIQQEIKTSVVMNIGYTGSKGTRLDIVRAPDQLPTGGPRFAACTPLTPAATDCVQPFLFESSEGASILHQATLRLRKRMRHGLSLGGTYTFSKSIDDASSIGGGATVVAQNDTDIAAERSLSSFDQRHRLAADYTYELPFGKDKKWLTKESVGQKILSTLVLSGNLTVASGTPFSPRFFGRSVDLSRGTTGSARPDLVPGQGITVSDPTIGEWFNTAAFAAPAGVFGTAGRNIITGPGTVAMDMAISKSIQLKEMQGIEMRLSATNVFNHVHFAAIDSTFGSPTFGQVTSAGAMRRAQITARYRF